MCQVMMTTTTSIPPVTFVCSGPFLITTMVTPAPTSVGQITSGQWDVALPPQLILRDTLRGSAGHLCVPQQRQSQMLPKAYANYAMDPLQVSFSFRVESLNNSYIMCLVSVIVFAFCFWVPMWLPCSPIGAQYLGFMTPQPFRVYPFLCRHLCLLVMVFGSC